MVEGLRATGYEAPDSGTHKLNLEDDLPDLVLPMAKAVAGRKVERGPALCGSDVGACVAANRIPGVRAALVTDAFSAHRGVEDTDMKYAFTRAIPDHIMKNNNGVLRIDGAVGNKKQYDPLTYLALVLPWQKHPWLNASNRKRETSEGSEQPSLPLRLRGRQPKRRRVPGWIM
jgi:hypothetical protein